MATRARGPAANPDGLPDSSSPWRHQPKKDDEDDKDDENGEGDGAQPDGAPAMVLHDQRSAEHKYSYVNHSTLPSLPATSARLAVSPALRACSHRPTPRVPALARACGSLLVHSPVRELGEVLHVQWLLRQRCGADHHEGVQALQKGRRAGGSAEAAGVVMRPALMPFVVVGTVVGWCGRT